MASIDPLQNFEVLPEIAWGNGVAVVLEEPDDFIDKHKRTPGTSQLDQPRHEVRVEVQMRVGGVDNRDAVELRLGVLIRPIAPGPLGARTTQTLFREQR